MPCHIGEKNINSWWNDSKCMQPCNLYWELQGCSSMTVKYPFPVNNKKYNPSLLQRQSHEIHGLPRLLHNTPLNHTPQRLVPNRKSVPIPDECSIPAHLPRFILKTSPIRDIYWLYTAIVTTGQVISEIFLMSPDRRTKVSYACFVSNLVTIIWMI